MVKKNLQRNLLKAKFKLIETGKTVADHLISNSWTSLKPYNNIQLNTSVYKVERNWLWTTVEVW